MKKRQQSYSPPNSASGQLLVMFAIMAVAVIAFVGLSLDAGNVYVTRSVLSRSVDSAVLTGIRNLGKGNAAAEDLARRAFAANYKGMGSEALPLTLHVAFFTDTNNNKRIQVVATSVVNTYFMRIFPRFRTFTMRALAEGTRANLIMSMILDRSGSMAGNGGSTQLPAAVVSFIIQFDDALDRAAMTSFASHARVDVTMRQPFKAAITTAVNAMPFVGGTFADGGLALGYHQIQTAPVTPHENVIKVAVFFTDGLANEFQYTWPTNRTYNIGGYDPQSGNRWGVFNITNGMHLATWPTSFPPGLAFMTAAGFTSLDGTTKSLSNSSAADNVRLEARLRAEATATAMRNSGITVYSIGLGNDSTIDAAFLGRIANVPDATTYDPNQPSGMSVITPNSSDLKEVFDTIAANILSRLTR